MKKNILTILFSFITFLLVAQSPVKWTFEAKCTNKPYEYELFFYAKIDKDWAIYSQYLESDNGPVGTTFEFNDKEKHYTKVSKCEENGDKKTVFDPIFEMNLIKFNNNVTFKQKVKVTDTKKPISGYLTFMACDTKQCLPPKDVDFKFQLPQCPISGKNNQVKSKPKVKSK